MSNIKIGNKKVGKDQPCFIIAEIGINHNGNVELAKQLIDTAVEAGCDAVKFQKRTIEDVYSKEELDKYRETPFGTTNRELKEALELDYMQYREIDKYCKEKNIIWFASPWDIKSVDFLEKFNIPCYKVASASLTDDELLLHIASKNKPILLSTGMSTLKQILHALNILQGSDIIIYHCTSTYPTDDSEINLNMVKKLADSNSYLVGFSGHEKGYLPSVASVIFGAVSVERHITLDRTMWGSDQSASLEPAGLAKMVRDIRRLPNILGNGIKEVYDSELPIIDKLRKVK